MKRQRTDSGGSAPIPALEVVEVEKPGKTLRAATYARVSSARQKTIHEQTRLCRERCDERGWTVRYTLSDHAMEGDDPARPGFNRLMDLAERQAIDVVVVWKIDRIARSLEQAVVLEGGLRRYGVAIHSVTESAVDTTTPIGAFIFGNIANAAQLEKAIIRERIRMGNHSLALQGRWLQPQVPLGYRRVKGMHLRVVESEAVVVRRVFDAYCAHQSYAEAATALRAEGLALRGKEWTSERVRQTLENELYWGKFAASGVIKQLPHLAIVSRERFDEARQLRLAAPRRGKKPSQTAHEASIDRVFQQYLDSLRDLPDQS